jgi:hypothetical protein
MMSKAEWLSLSSPYNEGMIQHRPGDLPLESGTGIQGAYTGKSEIGILPPEWIDQPGS